MDAQTDPREIAAAQPARKKRPPGVLLFLPGVLNRTEIVQWLKRIHAWTGFWGALMFLILGSGGLLLNHRATLKIDTGVPQEVMSAQIAVDPALIKSPEDLGQWAKTEFGLSIEPRPPRAEAAADQPERVTFMGREVEQSAVWKQSFNAANGLLDVEYVAGSAAVKATKSEQNALGFLKNLHKGVGMSWVWVLFIDTIAGALIAMSLTGALLWSRLHGPRLVAVGIVTTSLVLALLAAWPNMV